MTTPPFKRNFLREVMMFILKEFAFAAYPSIRNQEGRKKTDPRIGNV